MNTEPLPCPDGCGGVLVDRRAAQMLFAADGWAAGKTKYCAICRRWFEDPRPRSSYLGFAVRSD